jgi:hypothetical protein
MSTTHKTDRAVKLAKPARKPHGGPRGNMTPAEIKPLLFHARQAYDAQLAAGVVDDQDFNSWRHEQVMAAVGKPGLTACSHEDFRPLRAHFFTLAGRDSAAFRDLMTSGQPTDHAAPGDTFEARRELAWTIAQALEAHLHLAETTLEDHRAESARTWNLANPGRPFPGPDPVWLAGLEARKSAIESGGGPIHAGYLIWLVRQKTRRPDLHLGADWRAGLADRCTVSQLEQIRNTLVNRIAAREGLGTTAGRNKSARGRQKTADFR